MPIYEYYCPDCKAKFELLRRLSQASEAACCPRCQKAAGRVMSRCVSVMKDSGGSVTPTAGSSSCSSCVSSSCSTCHP